MQFAYNLVLCSHLPLYLPSVLFLSGFNTEILRALFVARLSTMYFAYIILLDLKTGIIFDEKYKL
jgi:hypothetical protein